MLINIKYLVITVISVFLALGIGILLGVQLDSQDIVLQQQESLIKTMEQKYDRMSENSLALENEVKALQEHIQRNEMYMHNIFSDYIKDKLKGVNANVSIIETTYACSDLKHTLKNAGANINSSILITDKVLNISDIEKNELLEYFGAETNLNIQTFIIQRIADIITQGNQEAANYLEEKGYIDIDGNLSAPNFVIIAGGDKEETDKPEIIDLPLIKELKKAGITVIGVEASDVPYSYIDSYKKARISTVDNVDSIIGQTSVVLIMKGHEGNFGIKKSARSLMPDLAEEEEK
ncbi:MAG TPA: copper transporter [Thermoanaerobacterales bacterium]|jgi:hypothetical protein|nr:copper transporter [Thermoanaerobacterales bacterium]